MLPGKAVIIGSGIGGMATAIRLSVQGYQVTVYEKNNCPGGKLTAFEKDGYSFDAGPSLFTQPQNLEALFELAGEPIKDYFSYQPVDIACLYFFENGKKVNAYTDAAAFAAEMEHQVNEPAQHISSYLKRAANSYEKIGTVFLDHSLQKRRTWLHTRTLRALGALKLPYLFRSLYQYNKRQFSRAETVQLFNRCATYNGSNPYQAPGMLSMIPHLEHNQGTFYPKGGMISITDALFRLAKKTGVEFHFDSPVQRIITHEGKVQGVVVGDKNILADMVVSNADVYFTYLHLLRNNQQAKKVLKQERSSSAIIFYWGVKNTFPQLQLHNIFFSKDYKDEFDQIFKKKQLTADPTIYINVTSKIEASLAPAGCENWFVMVNAPAHEGQDWEQLKIDIRSRIIEKLNRMLDIDLEPLIQTEQVLDPVMIESETASYKGSLYGSSSNSAMAAFLRHANFSNQIKGLYFCGGSVHPGGGIPLCLKSAMIVADLVQHENKKKH